MIREEGQKQRSVDSWKMQTFKIYPWTTGSFFLWVWLVKSHHIRSVMSIFIQVGHSMAHWDYSLHYDSLVSHTLNLIPKDLDGEEIISNYFIRIRKSNRGSHLWEMEVQSTLVIHNLFERCNGKLIPSTNIHWSIMYIIYIRFYMLVSNEK